MVDRQEGIQHRLPRPGGVGQKARVGDQGLGEGGVGPELGGQGLQDRLAGKFPRQERQEGLHQLQLRLLHLLGVIGRGGAGERGVQVRSRRIDPGGSEGREEGHRLVAEVRQLGGGRGQGGGRGRPLGVRQDSQAGPSLHLGAGVIGHLEDGKGRQRGRVHLAAGRHARPDGGIGLQVGPSRQESRHQSLEGGLGLALDVGQKSRERGGGVEGLQGRPVDGGQDPPVGQPLERVRLVVAEPQRRVRLEQGGGGQAGPHPGPDGFILGQAGPDPQEIPQQ